MEEFERDFVHSTPELFDQKSGYQYLLVIKARLLYSLQKTAKVY
jgi:hypothetical protein